jgi:hypothetical protein
LLLNIPLKKHIWKVAGIGMGIIFSILIIHIMQLINLALYPVESEDLVSESSAYVLFINSNPIFLVGILFSNATASFTGGAIARLTHPTVSIAIAGWVGAILMILDLNNLMMVDYPLWFWLFSIIVYIPSAWLGAFAITHFQSNITTDP